MTSVQPRLPEDDRRGAPWSDADHHEFVDCLLAGVDDVGTCAMTGRSIGALRARAKLMLGEREDSRRPVEQLREQLLANPDYDWRAAVQNGTAHRGGHYWTHEQEQILAEGWVQALPMRTLVDQLGVSEQVIVRQLLDLGLATSTVEAVSRLGCLPGGVLEMRNRLATDRLTYTVRCLVMTRSGEIMHISIHPHRADAERMRDEVLASDPEPAAIGWLIADRWSGGLNAGAQIQATQSCISESPFQER